MRVLRPRNQVMLVEKLFVQLIEVAANVPKI